MRRSVALALMLGAFAGGFVLAHGCTDERIKVREAVFACNPSAKDADLTCGAGYLCYAATQSLGGSVCVPRCTPGDAASCMGGVCTASGACLKRCTVSDPTTCPANSGLSCIRTTVSALDPKTDNGVCIPVNAPCTENSDCTSPVFDTCSNEASRATPTSGLMRDGHTCAQAGCFARGAACAPGSSCVKQILPPGVPTPDFCTPNCLSRKLKDNTVVNECPVGFTCLKDAFPQTNVRACAPGFAGWLCTDDLGCTGGACKSWEDLAPEMAGLRTCAPTCKVDEDCTPHDDDGNPSFVSKHTCRNGRCRTLSSLFYGFTCNLSGDACQLDPEARCATPPAPDGADGGMATPDDCDAPAPVPHADTANASFCARSCVTRADCATVANATHVPYACVAAGPGGAKLCQPAVPFATPCSDAADCLPGLSCIQLGPNGGACTRTCTSSGDCANTPMLGSSFACVGGLCVPKRMSGCRPRVPGVPDTCLGGILIGETCRSPKGWGCDAIAPQVCASGVCTDKRCE
jgi:hypothetical protein